jgi:hypothetical protein
VNNEDLEYMEKYWSQFRWSYMEEGDTIRLFCTATLFGGPKLCLSLLTYFSQERQRKVWTHSIAFLSGNNSCEHVSSAEYPRLADAAQGLRKAFRDYVQTLVGCL